MMISRGKSKNSGENPASVTILPLGMSPGIKPGSV
jgi:hypothetical protein